MGDGFALPNFDPCDGGVNAQVLFLLEAPGRKAVGSSFISRNNPDPSARTMCTLLAQAGLSRKASLLWNIVPWYIGNDSKIRPASKPDLAAALPFFSDLLQLLPQLQAIVLVGQKAQGAKMQLSELTNARFFETHHPSQQVMNRWPERRDELLATFKDIVLFLKESRPHT